MLLEESLLSELLGILDGVTDVDVVEEDVVLHGPDLEANSAHGLKVGGVLVLVVVGVGDLARSPGALVVGVVNERSAPDALVLGVLLHGLSPGAATRNLEALGVGNGRGDPVTVLLVIPVLRLLGLRVGNGLQLINEPVLGHGSLLIDNLVGRILIPVLGLLGLGVGNAGLVNPVLGLGVVGVVNLGLGVDGRNKVLEEAALLDGLAILLDEIGVVGVDNERVELSGLDDLGRRGRAEVLLLVLAGLGVLVVEDEVHLVGVAALVGTKHDDVGGGVGELVLVESLVLTEELQVSASALEAVCARYLLAIAFCVKD